ncbi:MAG: PolC-type DNA polymerase III [Lachnospiraceae bacterium]|jgi:DNA polymerase-3 subunit alpha (Gram-positive type)|nr:PolC-type DNA polymerase III [Lachnospiraceae bacterium]
MSFSFREAFPTLVLSEALEKAFSQTLITKITTTSEHDILRIHVAVESLLDKSSVNSIKVEIKNQLFPQKEMSIEIIELINNHIGEDGGLAKINDEAYPSSASSKTKSRVKSAQSTSAMTKKASHPDIIYGRDFNDGEMTAIADIEGEMGTLFVRGKIIFLDTRAIKNEKTIITINVTDFTDTIKIKLFVDSSQANELKEKLSIGRFVKIKGTVRHDKFDDEISIGSVHGIKKTTDFSHIRTDTAARKRVELHCHTKMSDMDGVADVSALIERAFAWGHGAIAITDHGVAHAFPEAGQTWRRIKGKDDYDETTQSAADSFKVIYGVEAYLIDESVDSEADTGNNETNSTASATDKVKQPPYHIIILAATETGRVNLYALISASHLDHFSKRPCVPRSLLTRFREGLIIGAACEAGELFQAFVTDKPASQLAEIASFYDYLEIQPVANNAFMQKSDKFPAINSADDLREINRRIVALGDELGKVVAATGDVHFLDPEDEVYRRIIMAGNGYADADEQAPLYLRTTEEMLAEFAYLGEETAQRVVVDSTNQIAAMIDMLVPLRPDKCPPHIENSDNELRRICYQNAHRLYGEPLPEVAALRLEKELDSIIGNGFAAMYIIAQKLVSQSVTDGYLVGSRGSVGSSFVATMAGITEVNPLRPHYYCRDCHFSDFDPIEVEEYTIRSGFDLPPKDCPICGISLGKDGFDIPFETFLGFEGDKEPDIDLNFSGEYQGRAHKLIEEIFSEGETYRAGTISTLAEKTAFGYVKKYYDERGIVKRRCEIERIVSGLTGIRKSTGQHPGGIILLPQGENINSFTPVQRPANDSKSEIVTTHFDYHSLEHNLMKLDILGHDDPTMLRMLHDLTGIDPVTIPFRDEKVMSLFLSTEAMGITPEQIGGYRLGVLGLPEFGTDFVIQMLEDTRPQTFFDLICISGLSHGTDVWLGNAQRLIKEGKATISTVISTRDDIMTYLIGKGLDSALSFNITESVRRGRGLTKEWEKSMRLADVPEWYISSCKKIKYMFPKAHAAAYVMMAWRIAYYKVYHPLAYYTAFFSIRASDFDYQTMCCGIERLEQEIATHTARETGGKLTAKEQGSLRDLRVVQEMYARGISFTAIDIYQAKSHDFQIKDGKIMAALSSIEGMGDKAAQAVETASKAGVYLSREDFRERTKVNKTVHDLLEHLGLLNGLPVSNQMSLFDVFG